MAFAENAEPLSHYPIWQVELTLESNTINLSRTKKVFEQHYERVKSYLKLSKKYNDSKK